MESTWYDSQREKWEPKSSTPLEATELLIPVVVRPPAHSYTCSLPQVPKSKSDEGNGKTRQSNWEDKSPQQQWDTDIPSASPTLFMAVLWSWKHNQCNSQLAQDVWPQGLVFHKRSYQDPSCPTVSVQFCLRAKESQEHIGREAQQVPETHLAVILSCFNSRDLCSSKLQ